MNARTPHERMQVWLSRLLIAGVWIAAVLCAAGIVLSLLAGSATPPRTPFAGVAPGLDSPMGVIRSAMRLEGPGVMAMGVLALVATPVLRVAFSLVLFVRERDRLYIGVTAVVLALLAIGLFTGLAE